MHISQHEGLNLSVLKILYLWNWRTNNTLTTTHKKWVHAHTNAGTGTWMHFLFKQLLVNIFLVIIYAQSKPVIIVCCDVLVVVLKISSSCRVDNIYTNAYIHNVTKYVCRCLCFIDTLFFGTLLSAQSWLYKDYKTIKKQCINN